MTRLMCCYVSHMSCVSSHVLALWGPCLAWQQQQWERCHLLLLACFVVKNHSLIFWWTRHVRVKRKSGEKGSKSRTQAKACPRAKSFFSSFLSILIDFPFRYIYSFSLSFFALRDKKKTFYAFPLLKIFSTSWCSCWKSTFLLDFVRTSARVREWKMSRWNFICFDLKHSLSRSRLCWRVWMTLSTAWIVEIFLKDFILFVYRNHIYSIFNFLQQGERLNALWIDEMSFANCREYSIELSNVLWLEHVLKERWSYPECWHFPLLAELSTSYNIKCNYIDSSALCRNHNKALHHKPVVKHKNKPSSPWSESVNPLNSALVRTQTQTQTLPLSFLKC